MKSFEITHAQIVAVTAAVTADELARTHGRYVESLAQSAWDEATPVGEGGAGVTPEQAPGCARRAAIFFGVAEGALVPDAGDTFGDWATQLQERVRAELTSFRFHPATHGGAADTRHAADDIWQDARGVAGLMQGRRRLVSLISTGNLMGLVCAVLAPNLQRIDAVDARRLTPDELAGTLAFGDVVVATPTLWRYLADTMPSVPGNVVGVSYGEALTADLAERLRGRGLGAVRELYGSTETGILAWRDAPTDPFVLFDHWSREAEGEAASALMRVRPGGGTARVLPMDELSWQGERSFHLGGRRDGAVQIGGVNVFPAKIAEIIEGQGAVAACEVRLSRRPGALDRLIAHVKLRPEVASTQDLAWAVDEWCRERLQPPERPRIYTFEEASA